VEGPPSHRPAAQPGRPQPWRRAVAVVSAVACVAAAACVWQYGGGGGGAPVALGSSDYLADSEDNVFSSHYLSPERRKYLAAHPPARKPVAAPLPKPKAAHRHRVPALEFSRAEASEVVDEIPGMGAREMKELEDAASAGHAKVVQPVPEPKPAKLSPEAIAQEHIRADDVFSTKYYNRAVPTAGHSIPSLHADSELHNVNGEAAAVMREAGKAFAMAEGGTHLPAAGKKSHPPEQMQAFVPAEHTSTLASVSPGRQALAEVPAVDRDLISNLDSDESEIDHMHIMSAAQRAIISPDSVEDIDSEALKKSINSLTSMNQQAERTGRQYGESGERRSAARQEQQAQERERVERPAAPRFNGDEGAQDQRQQMRALGRQASPEKKDATSTAALAKALQPGRDAAFDAAMRAAVKASNPDLSAEEDIPIGDAAMGDDSGGDDAESRDDDAILRDEKHQVHTERVADKTLKTHASPMWPSAEITRREEEREARKKRELEERERKIDEHEKELQEDAKAAARAQARAKREAEEAKKAREEAAAEERKEERAREEERRSRALERRVERQMAAFSGSAAPHSSHKTHALAAQQVWRGVALGVTVGVALGVTTRVLL